MQLAAALVFSPGLLVLDEPFAGLDPVAVDAMTETSCESKAKAGKPVVVLSSHQLDIVERLCDRVGIINHGQMVASGTVDELTAARSGCASGWMPPARPAGWFAGVSGATLVEQDGPRWLIELADRADDQALLRAALAEWPGAGVPS